MIDKCRKCGEEFDAEDFKGKVEHIKKEYGKYTSFVYYKRLFERVEPVQTRLGE